MKKKRAFTLLEIMIVIFLIGIIGSVIGYNMKGSLDKGKAFKTQQAKLKIKDILELEMAKGVTPERITEDPEKYLRASRLVKNPDKMMKDGWGDRFDVSLKDNGDLNIKSIKYSNWKRGQTRVRGEDVEEE
ncbi:MAG: type II secretion system protein [Simkaniaceae bacterium]|nr:type II secretion system protein [Candidatus Sacchlamyda saccharinae]